MKTFVFSTIALLVICIVTSLNAPLAGAAADQPGASLSEDLFTEAAKSLSAVIVDNEQSIEVREEAIRAGYGLVQDDKAVALIFRALLRVAGDKKADTEIRIRAIQSIGDLLSGESHFGNDSAR